MISYDKDLTKIILNHYNIPQVNYITIKKNYSMKNIFNKLKFPMIIKPAKCGSSIGINKVKNKKELRAGIDEALKYDNKIIIEEFIVGRELECAILDTKKFVVSDIGEIITNSELYDYNAKYNSSESKTIVSAELPNEVKKQIKDFAKKTFEVLGCKGMSRIDFFYNGNIYLNEINTIPGFTPISMYPMLLSNDKFTIKDLISELINNVK